jgi:hypothetical protein
MKYWGKGITHFIKNHFAKIPKDDQKISENHFAGNSYGV